VQAEALTTLGLLARQSTEEALSAFSRAVELAEAAGLLAEASRAHHNMATVLVEKQGSLRRRDTTLGVRQSCPDRLGCGRGALFQNQAVGIGLVEGDLAFAEQEIAALRRLLEMAPIQGRAR